MKHDTIPIAYEGAKDSRIALQHWRAQIQTHDKSWHLTIEYISGGNINDD